jgi:GNAT superfamily N-acetyltransferase
VDVDDKYRSTEWVLTDPSSEEVRDIAERASAIPRSWVTLVGARPDDLAGLEFVNEDEWLMATTLQRADASEQVEPEQVEIVERAGVAFATVMIDGVQAAHGQVAVVGRHAVIDRIKTEPEFQRRGLGRAMMAALTGWALDQGATDGLLVASQDGFELYARLGWQTLAQTCTMQNGLPSGSVSTT